MSSGTAAIGSTRPVTRSSRATQSSAATGSPSPRWSQSPAMSRLPTAWPASSPVPPNRCWTTRAHVVPQSSSPQSAASAIRRSPGGRMPNSCRSRPEDPPSSATVTIAVTSGVTRRSADSDAASPCPPPSATTFSGPAGLGEPAVRQAHSRPRSRWDTDTSCPARPGYPGDPGGELLGDGDRAVLAAGAADGDRDVALALALEPGQRRVEQRQVGVEERRRGRLPEHVLPHRRVEAAHRAQLGHPVRVRQEPAVGDQVGVDREPVLEPERDDVQPQPGHRVAAEVPVHPVPQLVHVQGGGVEHDVGVAADRAQQLALGRDPVQDRARALHRVRPPDVLEPPDQGRVRGLEEQHLRGDAARAERRDRGLQVGRERPRAHVHDRRDSGQRRPVGQVEHRRQQRRGQVVDHEPAEVLQ